MVRQQRLHFAEGMVRQSEERVPKRLMLGTLVGEADPGRGHLEKYCLGCDEDDARAFGAGGGFTAGDWPTFGIDSCVGRPQRRRGRGYRGTMGCSEEPRS